MTPRPSRNAQDPARTKHHFLIIQFIVSHAVHHHAKLANSRCTFVFFSFWNHFRHSRNHSHHFSQRSQLRNVLKLIVHIAQSKLPFHHPFVQFWIVVDSCFLHCRYQPAHISHSEQSLDKRNRIERLQLIHVFASSNECDWTFSRGHCRQSTTTFCVPIQLCNNHRSHFHATSKRLGVFIRCLANGRIHDKDHVCWIQHVKHHFHFIKQRRFLSMPTRRIHHNQLVMIRLEPIHAFLRNLDGISLRITSIEWNLCLGCVLLQLIKCSGAKCICTNHTRLPSTSLMIIRVLRARRCLSISL
mmetsp:Transcript_5412/g.9539  ORF Transcript_5412/g.9539 Transcript_5412/m.9539 type:complete len:300 (-) Transcript_5412:502-1401(-)